MDTDKIEAALRKALKYIRTVEAWKEEAHTKAELIYLLFQYADGYEIKAIEDALLELGVVV